jgi:DNA-binding XRE family transcriptional regulator
VTEGGPRGGPGSGNHKPGRRRQAAELRAQGLTLAAIGRELNCTKQAVYQLLRPPSAYGPASRKRPACAACRADLGGGPGLQDSDPPLCLARRPRATFGQRLRAHRIALGLSRRALAEKAGVGTGTVLEQSKHRPQPPTLRKLARALGVDCTAFADCEDVTGEELDAPTRTGRKDRTKPEVPPEGGKKPRGKRKGAK